MMSLLQSSCICGQVRPETGEEGKERDMGGLHECHDISKGQHWHPREPALGEGSLGASQHCSGTAVGGLGEAFQEKIQALPCNPSLWDDPAAALSCSIPCSCIIHWVLGKYFQQITGIGATLLTGTPGTSFFSSLSSAWATPCARAATGRGLGKHRRGVREFSGSWSS